MRVLAVMALKGGVGKTTTALNVAACLAERRESVLLIDLDAQRSLTAWLGLDGASSSTLDVLEGAASLADAAQTTPIPGVDLIPSTPGLAGLDRMLATEPGGEGVLRAAIKKARSAPWDWLLIDCPPGMTLATANALTAAQEVLACTFCDVLALAGLGELVATVERVRERLNPDLELAHLLPCRVSRTRLARDVLEALRSNFGAKVLPPIRESARVPECFAFNASILEHDPTGRAAADYRLATDELRRRAKKRRKARA